jgi:isopenicillin-N N-acyltransferase like protein
MSERHDSVELCGSAVERGRQQAASRPALADRVRLAVRGRLEALGPALARPRAQDYLQAQTRFLQAHDRPGFDESLGIAAGYGIAPDDLLAYLHGNVLSDMATPEALAGDGCTAWAHREVDVGAFVVKNRDYRGEHGALQQVFRHLDPAWGGRALLCLGSLGSPGAFSSGINSDGLAVADTQIGTRDHGVGWLRYFLMTALLRECVDVAEALAFIAAVPHAGGGSLILGDRGGALAAVELGHRHAPHVEQPAVWTARTNHDLSPRLAADMLLRDGDLSDSTFGRLDQVRDAMTRAAGCMDTAQVRALMSSHREVGFICRHATDERLSRTLSCAIYETASATLHLSHGNPCEAQWSRYSLSDSASAGSEAHP